MFDKDSDKAFGMAARTGSAGGREELRAPPSDAKWVSWILRASPGTSPLRKSVCRIDQSGAFHQLQRLS
jgi:hypothetical protein